MSDKIKIGDLVIVNGKQDGVTFEGQKGIVVTIQTSYFGINFVGFMSHGFFHTIDGTLLSNTGFNVNKEYVRLASRRKTGYGTFISRIEGNV